MRIPIRYLKVELGTTTLFAIIWLRYPGSWEASLDAFYSSLLIVFLVIDLERGTIPGRVYCSAIAVALLLSLWAPKLTLQQILAGGLIDFGLLCSVELLFPPIKGMGVAKLAAFIRLAIGYFYACVALIIASILGLLVSDALMLAEVIDRKDTIAIGPFMAVGAIAALLFGELILSQGADAINQIAKLVSFQGNGSRA